MAITSSQNNGDGIVRFASGNYFDDGTVTAIEIDCGFTPRYVRVQNETSRDGMEWFEGMAAAEGIKTVAAGTRTLVTSNGITTSDRGFTIGLDTDVVVTSEQLSWYALG